MKAKPILLKLIGIFSTATLITASVTPGTLHIPIHLRPWIFLTTIAWTTLIVSGVFVP